MPATRDRQTQSEHDHRAERDQDRQGDGQQHVTASAGKNRWWTVAAVCTGTFILLLDITIINVALPDIQTSLSASFSDLQWVVDAYALSLAALLLTAGSLADRFGRKRLYVIGLGIFTVSSLLCGISTSVLLLQLSRGLQGVGGSIMFAVSLALIADAFRDKSRTTAFGIWGAVIGVAVSIGPLLGGALTTGLSWRWIFFVNLPIGVAAIVLTVRKVTESRSADAHRPDWAGFALFTVALGALVYGLIESNEKSFSDPIVVSSLVTAAVALVAFAVVEWRTDHPALDLTLFRKPTFTGGAVAAFGLSASIFALQLYLVLYIQDVLAFDPLDTGLRLLVFSAAILGTSTVVGALAARVPARLLIGPGLALVGLGLLLMRGLDAGSQWTDLIWGLVVSGIGIGMVNPPLASTAVGVVDADRAGMASGINDTFRQVGIATGIALLGTLFSSHISSYIGARVSSVPGLEDRASGLVTAVQSGAIGQTLKSLPARSQQAAAELARSAFTSGLNLILLVAACIALAAGLISLLTIRSRDFVDQEPESNTVV